MKENNDGMDRQPCLSGGDCEQDVRRLIGMLFRYIDDPTINNAFWVKLKNKFQQANGGSSDNGRNGASLLLIHSYINNIQELFEEHEDGDALRLLAQIEMECC